MTIDLAAVAVEATDPDRVSRFWAALLASGSVRSRVTTCEVSLPDGTGFALRFVPSSRPKRGQNLAHLDLTSASLDEQRSIVDTALRLGARHVDVGQRDEERHVVLGDVEGNEFCVVEPGNRFLAGCGAVGAVACDGSRAVGHFWAAALGWPLVWDQDEETAIQAPPGGPKISWGGPPPMPRIAADRVFFELVTTPGSDSGAEVDRLISLGATRRAPTFQTHHGVDLSDPDGNLFRMLVR